MKDKLSYILKNLKNQNEVRIKFVVLFTDEKSLCKRDDNRPVDCRMGKRVLVLLENFRKENFAENFVLDSSKLDENQTAFEILKNERFVVKDYGEYEKKI